MTPCFHCSSTPGRCNCVSCNGACEACAGRAKFAKESAAIDKYRVDVRNSGSYELVRSVTGSPHRRLKIIHQLNQEAA